MALGRPRTDGSNGYVSQREFCRRVKGASLSAIGRAARSGALTRGPDGAIKWPEGRDEWTAIKAAEAEAGVPDGDVEAAIQRATLRLREGQALGRELENAQTEGRLVALDVVQADARAAVEIIRASLLSLPSRVALKLEAVCAGQAPRAPQIEAIIHDEINAMMVTLQSSKFVTT